MINEIKQSNKGSMLVLALVATGIFMTILLGAITLAQLQRKLNEQKISSAQALHIAEAGVNYYRWVLYRDQEEYCNQETCLSGPDYGPYGPYEYTDFSGAITGEYELYITPPPTNGSTIVTIKSIGWTSAAPNTKRVVEVQCGIPSWSTFSNLTDSEVAYGSGAVTTGPVHSNTGIVYYAGSQALDMVTASELIYDGNDGVHTTDPGGPAAVFQGGRDFGPHIPKVSFGLLDNFASDNYGKAASSGLIVDPSDFGSADPDSIPAERGCISSGECDEGYHITFISNDRFELRRVSSLQTIGSTYGQCSGVETFSINTETAPLTYDIPANGIIFVKHSVWVDGTVGNGSTGTRATVMAFKEPFSTGDADIIVNNDLLYTLHDGSDSVGLIAQNDFIIGLAMEDDLVIEASILAKNGRKIRHNYSNTTCGSVRSKLTINGSQCSFLQPSTGDVNNREYNFDGNIMFNPPPHFPTTGQYQFLSWDEE